MDADRYKYYFVCTIVSQIKMSMKDCVKEIDFSGMSTTYTYN